MTASTTDPHHQIHFILNFSHNRISVHYGGVSGVSNKLILMIFGYIDVTSNTIIIMNPVWNWVTKLVFERL